MPIFDPAEQRMAVRVVYDGVAWAGKTTNLRQLCSLFAAQRRSLVESPADLRGRTMYFDWMQILAGVVCGIPLLCQMVTVPGQVVLTPRRRRLLEGADAVVYVCDAHEAAVPAARAGLALVDELARARGAAVPLVIQANKQDAPGALDGPALLRALGREGTPVVEAIASEGVGVVDTFVTAVRTVAREVQSRADDRSLRLAVRRADSAADLLRAIADEDLDPERAAEMLLEEVQAEIVAASAAREVDVDAGARAAAEGAASVVRAALGERVRGGAPLHGPTAAPPPPSADVPTGFVWPAHTGRATIRALGAFDAADPTSEAGVVVHKANGHAVRTSVRARFADGETARQALVRGARACTQLGALLVPDTVLVAQPAPDGACWIWTIAVDVPSIRALLDRGEATPELLAAFAAAAADALRAGARNGFSVDITLASFGVHHGRVRYVGEIASDGPRDAAAALADVAREVELAGLDPAPVLEAFEREVERRLTTEERARVSLLPSSTRRRRATQEPAEREAS